MTVAARPELAWEYLSDVGNLPEYMDSMTSAEPAGRDAVHVTAETPGGRQEGEAWFRTEDAARRLEWGSEGASDYHGWLTVVPAGAGCLVSLGIDMDREDEDDSIGRTLANVQRLLEGRAATP